MASIGLGFVGEPVLADILETGCFMLLPEGRARAGGAPGGCPRPRLRLIHGVFTSILGNWRLRASRSGIPSVSVY